MLFASQSFLLVFLPLVVGLYYAVADSRRARQAVVIGASLLFYGLWDWRFLPFLLGLTGFNQMVAMAWGRTRRRGWLWAGVGANLLVLFGFKYADWLVGAVCLAMGRAHAPWPVILPLGLSFFVFQKISYLIDLGRGQARVYRLADFVEFVTFFPQLVAGPIVRHNELIPQFDASPRNGRMWANLGQGGLLVLVGLAKKVGLADTLGSVCTPVFAAAAGGHAPGLGAAWLAAVAYMLQIYFDFSGYSDMAIGMALMMGIRLPFNFNAPYRAVSVRDFWRRWHMTLSRFLRDYVYIPLGGNRCAPARQACNVLVTMGLAGLWHGAGWTFLLWGLLHGAALAVVHAWDRAGLRIGRLASHVLTLLFVLLTWVVFRADSLPAAGRMLGAMAGTQGMGGMTLKHPLVLVLAGVVALVGPASQQAVLERVRPTPWLAVGAGLAFVLLVFLMGGRPPEPFIYFQF
ncbi:MBOAT family protein [Komagataeibacter rhaeticus]|uniref:MBOAT family O-acyltransferase n=1 Tax=Komagataeibacter rhaeticus TaxID=215221 RepID=UPI0004D6DB1A|nr:MBOAT family O-acyltransferase [Komagataeibacter rhaeticus]KDU95311.1 acyltransferase [Komagataeibacter rhaeticus AF1]MBL7240985.1 MBOAT family protein [Komagataeibacter rhaeticus]PYD53989.1 MBOAT family protein [Komagataeibacter rhaeticus]GBQ17582.1 alginate O-acetyltransferase [Komagataeibacter rhaeticus DSM 16663]